MKKVIVILIISAAVIIAIVLFKQSNKQQSENNKKEYVKTNIDEYLRVSANDYSVDPFGGISNLSITVKNSSDYTVDDVSVEINYYKVNDELYKKETLDFHNLQGQSSSTLKAPDSDRGVKVKYKITNMRSDVLGI